MGSRSLRGLIVFLVFTLAGSSPGASIWDSDGLDAKNGGYQFQFPTNDCSGPPGGGPNPIVDTCVDDTHVNERWASDAIVGWEWTAGGAGECKHFPYSSTKDCAQICSGSNFGDCHYEPLPASVGGSGALCNCHNDPFLFQFKTGCYAQFPQNRCVGTPVDRREDTCSNAVTLESHAGWASLNPLNPGTPNTCFEAVSPNPVLTDCNTACGTPNGAFCIDHLVNIDCFGETLQTAACVCPDGTVLLAGEQNPPPGRN